jgi:hypothetical protein
MGDPEATTILVVIASLHKLMVQEFEHGQQFLTTSEVVDIGLPHTTIKKIYIDLISMNKIPKTFYALEFCFKADIKSSKVE